MSAPSRSEYKRDKLRNTIAILLLLIIALGCFGVIAGPAITLLWSDGWNRPCFGGDLKELEAWAEFEFPPSANNIESECTMWQSALIRIWFDMHPRSPRRFHRNHTD